MSRWLRVGGRLRLGACKASWVSGERLTPLPGERSGWGEGDSSKERWGRRGAAREQELGKAGRWVPAGAPCASAVICGDLHARGGDGEDG